MKKYILIAGVNGAGKSTLYQTLGFLKNMPRVNTDEIVREFGDWRNISDVMRAGKIGVYKIKEYFEKGISFNQETTLCGNSIIRNIDNTIAFKRFAVYEEGKRIELSDEPPKWYEKVI